MLTKIITIILDWIVKTIIIPISLVIVDYFQMKKTIKQTKAELEALKAAKTVKEKDEAIDKMP